MTSKHCSRGHRMTEANTTWQLNGKGQQFRACRQCNRERAKAWREANAHRLWSPHSGAGKVLRPEFKR